VKCNADKMLPVAVNLVKFDSYNFLTRKETFEKLSRYIIQKENRLVD